MRRFRLVGRVTLFMVGVALLCAESFGQDFNPFQSTGNVIESEPGMEFNPFDSPIVAIQSPGIELNPFKTVATAGDPMGRLVETIPTDRETISRVSGTATVVHVDGKPWDVDDFIETYYQSPWTYPGTIDQHLSEHGLTATEIASIPPDKRKKFHSAIHERERRMRTTTTTRSTTQGKPVFQSFGNCPGGVCPAPTRFQIQPRKRSGLFSFRRN